MNSNFKTMGLLALAGAAIVVSSTSTDAVTYNNGDLFLGFRASAGAGATTTYLINIGQASTYRDAASGSSFSLSLGNIGADLVRIYGANWNTRADLFWGVAGGLNSTLGSDPINTLYASKAELTIGTLGIGWDRRSNSAQSTTISKLNGLELTFQSDSAALSSTVSAEQSTGEANNWASYQPGGANANPGNISFAAWGPTVEGNFGNGSAGTALDLFRMQSSATTGLQGSYEGTFTVSDSGTVTYTVVPEPSAIAVLAAGLGFLGTVRRRKTLTA